MEHKGRKPRVSFDGVEYVVRSHKTVVPNLADMSRFEALIWLGKHTFERGYSRATNPLAGLGGVIKVSA